MGHHDWARHFGGFDRHAHREGWGRHGGGESRRSRARMFEQGDLRFVVLKLLADKPAHGYEIIKAVEERFGGTYAPSPGIVYPTLTLLEEQGFIAIVEESGPRKLYGLTDAGRAELTRSTFDVDRVFARMEEYRRRHGGGPAPEIIRAMENLQTALRLRLDRGTPDDVKRITGLLDGAARAIEDL
jgi:DNA-binding PadR family transcriptional regulator